MQIFRNPLRIDTIIKSNAIGTNHAMQTCIFLASTNFGAAGMKLKADKKGPLEIRYRALAKKIRQCEDLEKKKKEGATLDQWQLAKLRKKPFVKAEIRALKKAVGGDEAGEEDDSEDSGSEDEDDDDEE